MRPFRWLLTLVTATAALGTVACEVIAFGSSGDAAQCLWGLGGFLAFLTADLAFRTGRRLHAPTLPAAPITRPANRLAAAPVARR